MDAPVDRRTFLKLAGGCLALGGSALRADQPTAPSKGLVLGPPEAVAAGMAVLAAGGNAVDGAVAAALVAGVVAVPSCGIGGYGGHLVIALADGSKVTAIDFNSVAPAAGRADMFPLDHDGAVKGRLERGRRRLAERLGKRGFAPQLLLAATVAAAVPEDLFARAVALAPGPVDWYSA